MKKKAANNLRLFLLFACVVAGGVVAAQNQPAPSSTPTASDETVPREFLGFTDSHTFRGVIDDPDGYVNLRAKPNAGSPIIAKVKKGERFTFQRHEYDPWCKVKLDSGKTGWMDAQRILLSFTKDDLPGKPEEGDEIDQQARHHGIDYYEVTQGAVRGDVEARKKFFQVSDFADGAGGEEHAGVLGVALHLIGDDALAAFLRSQPVSFQVGVRNSIEDEVTWPFHSTGYLQHHFPKTSKLFFRRQITDWPSPDGKYAFHKVFSDQYTDEDSTVTRSELIDKASGKRVLDLTKEDHGAGRFREGDVEWAPDSKGFLFTIIGTHGEPDIKLYFWSGKSFSKIDLPRDLELPAEQDAEIADAAYLASSWPTVHWTKPNILVSEITSTYTKTGAPPDAIKYFERKYETTITIAPDGKVTSEKKRITTPP